MTDFEKLEHRVAQLEEANQTLIDLVFGDNWDVYHLRLWLNTMIADGKHTPVTHEIWDLMARMGSVQDDLRELKNEETEMSNELTEVITNILGGVGTESSIDYIQMREREIAIQLCTMPGLAERLDTDVHRHYAKCIPGIAGHILSHRKGRTVTITGDGPKWILRIAFGPGDPLAADLMEKLQIRRNEVTPRGERGFDGPAGEDGKCKCKQRVRQLEKIVDVLQMENRWLRGESE